MINTKHTYFCNVDAMAMMVYSADNQGFTPPPSQSFECVNSAAPGLRHTFVYGRHIDSRRDVATVSFQDAPLYLYI